MHRNSQYNDEKCYKPTNKVRNFVLVKYESARSRFKTPNEHVYQRLQKEKSKAPGYSNNPNQEYSSQMRRILAQAESVDGSRGVRNSSRERTRNTTGRNPWTKTNATEVYVDGTLSPSPVTRSPSYPFYRQTHNLINLLAGLREN